MKALFNTQLTSLLLVAVSLSSFAKDVTTPVAVEPVTIANINSKVNIHGTVYGKGDVNLTAGAQGLLTFVAEPGTVVNKGDVIARIDMLPLQLEKQQQQALIDRAKLNLNYHQKEVARLKSLQQIDAAAVSKADQMQNAADLARSDIELAKIKLKQINDKITKAQVSAPFAGIVAERFVQAGADVNRAQKLVRLLDTQNLQTHIYVPVKYLTRIQLGDKVTLALAEGGETKATATVTAVIPATDPRSQTFEVRAKVEGGQGLFASGQLVSATLTITDAEPSTLVNRDALIIRRDKIHVVKINAQNKAEHVPVSVGGGQDELVAVVALNSKSLKAGDSVAIRGAERVQEGQTVAIQNAPKA